MNKEVIYFLLTLGFLTVIIAIIIGFILFYNNNVTRQDTVDTTSNQEQPNLLLNMEPENDNFMSMMNPFRVYNGFQMDINSAASTVNTLDYLTSPITTPLSDDIIQPILPEGEMEEPEIDLDARYYNAIDAISVGECEEDIYLLMHGGKVIKHKDKTYLSNIYLSNLVVFDGYVYGLSADSMLYMLTNPKLDTNIWTFEPVSWCQLNKIKFITTTLDEDYLWLQDMSNGYLYNTKHELIETVAMDYSQTYRIYGKNKNKHKDITRSINRSAVLDYYGDLHTSNEYALMRIIDWKAIGLVF